MNDAPPGILTHPLSATIRTGARRCTVALLGRLRGVKTVGPDHWMARCSAHEDRIPRLSIRKLDDRALLNCLAYCDTDLDPFLAVVPAAAKCPRYNPPLGAA